MRKRSLLITATAAIIYLTTSSYSGGPAHGTEGNKTGSPGGNGEKCNKCHSGTGITTGSLELRNKDWGASSTPINYYEAGKTYIVTVKGSHATNTRFGFQVVALNSSNAYVGTYGNFPSNVHGFPHASPQIIEHNTAIQAQGGAIASFEWTAPSAATGPITLYGIVNAVNNDGTNGGDMTSNTLSLMLTDKTSVAQVTKMVVIRAYPNPVQDVLTLNLDKADAGIYEVVVYSASGAVVASEQLNIQPGNYNGTINASAWAHGLYFVHIQKDGDKRVIPITK